MKPLVSIIIPTYNRAHCIGETLQSVQNQSYDSWECLVVDDGSDDTTEAVVNAYAKADTRIQLHKRPETATKGANACRNLGVAHSSGAYIIFLDSDDVLHENTVEKRVQCMMEHLDLDFAVFGVSYFYPDGSIKVPSQKNVLFENHNDYLLAFLSYDIPWVITSPIWKRHVCEAITWDEDLKRLQDIDFHIRVLLEDSYSFKRFDTVDTKIRAAQVEKMTNPSHILPVLESFDVYVQKMAKHTAISTPLRKHFKKAILFFEKKYLLPGEKSFPKQVKKVRKTIAAHHLFTLKERIIIRMEFNNIRRGEKGIRTIASHRIHTLFKKTFTIA